MFGGVGLELGVIATGLEKAFLGADTSQQGERLVVLRVPAGTPAYEQGLNTGDVVMEVDGARASQADLQSTLARKRPGDKLKLTVRRFDELRTLEITLGGQVPGAYQLMPVPNSGSEQKRLYKDWLKANLGG